MLDILRARLAQKHRTFKYPKGPLPALPDMFQGRPVINGPCPDKCDICLSACPVNAIGRRKDGGVTIDTGRCLFCGACSGACPHKSIVFTRNHQLAAARREDLVIAEGSQKSADAVSVMAKKYFSRSLKLRQVSAGGCNACEADVNVLGTPAWDMGRFGIQFVASPRHADGLLVTGPVTANMALALQKTYEALPEPRVVIACGSCAISGGPFADHPEANNGAGSLLPVDLYIPGCPPHPLTALDGLLRFLGRTAPGFGEDS
ncbi:MAG: NADH-quinone oxidoreductase subunit NuoB [Deltaproteobacteria bacterium]|nr:NADH-quinone oxidoreductase subunit NuoB [Deltaproteobacteria bacterium]